MRLSIAILFVFLSCTVQAQELFPLNEPASNVPKGALGVRAFGESYKEVSVYRNLFGIRLMYGVTSKLSVYLSASVSNHHGTELPEGLATHTHSGNQTIYSTGNKIRGVRYPYAFNGDDAYIKYRFITVDGQNRHFRMAAYGEFSNVNVAHDENEPTLLDDTKGYGGGIISTYLVKHFAASLTTGFIVPMAYKGYSPDPYGGADVPTKLVYGQALVYNLSLGYLLLPHHYKNYNQTNWNIYVELMGKSYGQAKVYQGADMVSVPIQTPLLKAGNYIEIYPGLQCILKSNLRIDMSVGFPMVGTSYVRFYPVYMFGIQRYFYAQ
ncbi:MAG: hypothetical protein JSS96_13590 [Bacteroidetes bacterium]|nr:hypothetical protein [Bacteroidota bacterium]